MMRRVLLMLIPALVLPGYGGVLIGSEPPAPTTATEWPAELTQWVPIAGNPVFHGRETGWDRKIRERGYLLRDETGYQLWYTGYNDAASPLRLLGRATSTDGLTFRRDPDRALVEDLWVEDMCVLKHEGIYYLFAEGERDRAHAMISRDGVKWESQGRLDVRMVDGTPISDGPYGTPTVWLENGVWSLFYERGDRGVWLAVSRDRKVWTNVQNDPVIPMGPDAYDLHAVALNQVISYKGVYYGVYHANAHKPWKDWTTCLARSVDLRRWEKYPRNPLVANNSSSGMFVQTPQGWRLYTMHPEVRVYLNPKK